MENGTNPSVEWPGLNGCHAQKHKNDTFEMSTLYYMVQGLYEPYVSPSQVLSWAAGLFILQESTAKVLDWSAKMDKSSIFWPFSIQPG